jgi:hypothetical protein
MKQALILALATATVLAACGSTSEGADTGYEAVEVDCICGTPEEAFHGCPHALCISGAGNPDNQDCVCGRLSIEE